MKKDYQKLAEEFIEELQATVQSGVDLQYKQGAYGFAQFLQSQEEKEEPKYQGCSTGACPKVSHSGNCGCKCHREPKEVKLINEFVEAYDFESLAKSYRESEIAWSKNEWSSLLREIKKLLPFVF